MKFVCPRCRGDLQKISDHEIHCPVDDLSFQQIDGIWRFLLPERKAYYTQFVKDYETIRRLEGRQSKDLSYYRSLPFNDTSGKFSADWKIRAASYRLLEKIVSASDQIVDLGAGNGWLSNRLASLGFQVYAVDLVLNQEDGLGVWRYYENRFIALEAEFSRLPFTGGFASAIIFNASFHYSENYNETLQEALRVVQAGGKIVVMDSPVYHHAESGKKMVAERKSNFLSQYGFASDSLQSKNYVTYEQMKQLGKTFGIRWQHRLPFYGIRWMLRPWLARLRGQREPAEFGLWVGTRL